MSALFDSSTFANPADLERFAAISTCGRFRYALSRAWVPDPTRYVLFVGLNPSTADGMVEDPTIRRCIGFAKSWGFDGLWMGNLYAYRATDPRKLPAGSDGVGGDRADEWLRRMRAKSEMCVVAWGCAPDGPVVASARGAPDARRGPVPRSLGERRSASSAVPARGHAPRPFHHHGGNSMNNDGHIYMAPEDEIPAEDKARLDGFLRGRAEADMALLRDVKNAAYEAKVREMQEAAGGVVSEGDPNAS
jgi:hypothetical protein